MKGTITYPCKACGEYSVGPFRPGPFSCAQCGREVGRIDPSASRFEQCPACPCRQFYLAKDFNPTLGCLILAVSVILVPWTYGLSLPVCAFIDWLLYRRIPTLIKCYQCGCEFRGVPPPQHLKPFSHHIGIRYDKFRK